MRHCDRFKSNNKLWNFLIGFLNNFAQPMVSVQFVLFKYHSTLTSFMNIYNGSNSENPANNDLSKYCKMQSSRLKKNSTYLFSRVMPLH